MQRLEKDKVKRPKLEVRARRALRLAVRYIGIGERMDTSSSNAKLRYILLLEIDQHAMLHGGLDAIELALCGSECW